jgi:hypothetical protein
MPMAILDEESAVTGELTRDIYQEIGSVRVDRKERTAELGVGVEFAKLQKFLRSKASIDLGDLERALENDLASLFRVDSILSLTEKEKIDLATKLLLWYAVGWSIADVESDQPLSPYKHPAIDKLSEHRRRMGTYATRFHFPEPYREALCRPEGLRMPVRLGVEAVALELRLPKGEMCFPSPLFVADPLIQISRYYEPLPPASVAELWGKDNFRQSLVTSPRTHFLVNRLMWKAGLGTSKLPSLTFYF